MIKCLVKYICLEPAGKHCILHVRRSVLAKQVFSHSISLDVIGLLSNSFSVELRNFCFICNEDPSPRRSMWSQHTPGNSQVPKLWNNGVAKGIPGRQASISSGRAGPAHVNLYQHGYVGIFHSSPAIPCLGINPARAGG